MDANISAVSGRAIEQHGTNMTNRLRWIQALGAHVDAVLNAVTTKYAERIVQFGQSIFCGGVSTVGEEAIGLQQPAGPTNRSGFHQKEGQLVEQQAQRMHSYNPSSWARSSGD